ncbi:MAG TPA: hypothetical protein VK208_09045 [Pyrinomonadaceae bacterium]|jgi:hypothetical protein|nr:hypothetical protein [Pyrinomonadaceae bacterium]
MRHLRLLVIALATIFVLALGAFALVGNPPSLDPGDDIIIKGGSLEIQCGKNHNTDCLGTNDNMGKYKHKQSGKHIMQVVVKDSSGGQLANNNFDKDHQPTIVITYK